jgi:hypothetical protein
MSTRTRFPHRDAPLRLPVIGLAAALLVCVAVGPASARDGTAQDSTAREDTVSDPPAADPLPPHPLADPPPVGEQEQPTDPQAPTPPPLDPSPQLRVVLAKLAIMRAEDLLANDQHTLTLARAELDAHNRRRDEAQASVIGAERRLDQARQLLAEVAVSSFMYATGGASSPTARLTIYERKKERTLTRAVMENRVELVRQSEEALATARRGLERSQAAVDESAARVAQQEAAVALAEQMLDGARRELRVAQASDVPVPYDPGATDRWQLSIAGESVLTPEELTAWFEHVGGRSRAAAPVADLARWYVEEGAAEGLRGDVAFAQAVLETGGFTNDDTVRFNNYAGIGHCDSCPTGWSFPSPQQGVRAQIQLLKSYVFERPEYRFDLVDRRLRGPAGCCQTWNQLTGVWASASHYGPSLLAIYLDMAEFALGWRTMLRSVGAGG